MIGKYSKIIGSRLGIDFIEKEFNYGKGIGRADRFIHLSENKLLVLEIEWAQRHPEMNVLKVWPYLTKNTEKKILLVQYIVDRTSVSPNRIELCNWLGAKMEKDLEGRFEYHLFVDELKDEAIIHLKNTIKNSRL